MPSVCVLPGLIWPSAEAAEALRGIALPGFATLLGHASLQQSPAISLESWLAEQFGLSSKPPFAALRLAGENNFLGDTPPALDASENWLCADPVALQFSRQHLLLSDPATLDIQNDEALSIISALNETFADVGHFYAASMTRWYLRTSADIDVHFHALAQVIGRSVAHFQPEGRKQAFWAQVGNELQVFCHNHPVNTAREAAGKPPLNAIWLWGAGRLPVTPLHAPADAMATTEKFHILTGLAKLAGSPLQPLRDPLDAKWIMVTDLIEPAMRRDLSAWLDALRHVDATVLQPLARALKRGQIENLEIVAPCDQSLLTLDIHAIPRWQFWRRDASAADIVKLLAGNEVAA